MSEIRQRQESILLLDLGTCNTKAVLLDLVEGQYGPVATAQAPSTARDPWQNLSIGAVEAISRLEEICGRTLLEAADSTVLNNGPADRARVADRTLITPEDEDGRGIDRLLVVSSASEPLRVLLAGGVPEISLASARRALHSTYARAQDVIAVDRKSAGTKIDAVLNSNADLVLLVGGTEGGASEPIVEMVREVLRVALYLMGEDAPPVIYAGNQALADEIAELFEGVAEVEVTDNVRPAVDVEDISPAAQALNAAFYEQKMRALPGLRTIRGWSRTLILPTARATETAIRCCAQVFETDKPALGVDLGSASVAIHIAQDQHARTVVRTDLGMGKSLLGLLEQVEAGDITRWLPFELEEDAFLDWFYHKAYHPQTVPQTRRDLLLELAAAREVLRLALADLLPAWEAERGLLKQRHAASQEQKATPPCDPIVGSGSLLARAPHPGLAALVLLDGLLPLGVNALYQDENSLLPAVGSVAKLEPLATVQVLRGEGLLSLGTVVAPLGRARLGARALRVRSLDPEVEVDQVVGYGELRVLSDSLLGDAPEPPRLELIPARGFDVGRGPGRSVQINYKPGAVGLIVDARGRPLEFASAGEPRRSQMDEWLFTMTGERGT
jgi:uncharacterized protein (TIGR01319 family)